MPEPRPLSQIIAHIRAVVDDPSIDITLIQTQDLGVLCDAAEQAEQMKLALQEVLAYRRGEGKHNYSRYFTAEQRDMAAFDGWQKVEEQIEAALAGKEEK